MPARTARRDVAFDIASPLSSMLGKHRARREAAQIRDICGIGHRQSRHGFNGRPGRLQGALCSHVLSNQVSSLSMATPPNRQAVHWRFILVGIFALALIGLVIVYKYTGDFSGLATWGTSRQPTPR
jgi:hypothetical protein